MGIFLPPYLILPLAVLVLFLRVAWSQASIISRVSTGFTVTRVPNNNISDSLIPILNSPDEKFSLLLTGCSIALIMQNSSQKPQEIVWMVDYRDCQGGIQDEWNSLQLQGDGDLVIYANSSSYGIVPRWRTNTGSKGVKAMQLSLTGILQLVDENSSIVWQSSDYLPNSLMKTQNNVRQLLQHTRRNLDQNGSCIFDSSGSYTYLHLGYVYYFNITYRESFQAAIDSCLNSCSQDCSCSAAVYDIETQSCYEFHQYIPVQNIPTTPVQPGENLSVYVKVQKGSSSSSNLPQSNAHSITTSAISSLVIHVAVLILWAL